MLQHHITFLDFVSPRLLSSELLYQCIIIKLFHLNRKPQLDVSNACRSQIYIPSVEHRSVIQLWILRPWWQPYWICTFNHELCSRRLQGKVVRSYECQPISYSDCGSHNPETPSESCRQNLKVALGYSSAIASVCVVKYRHIFASTRVILKWTSWMW